MPRVIGISEGMVLAERYRLVRRHEDLGTGEFWGGVDQETGSEVWVCFSDRPGLGRIAGQMQEWKAAATPRVLDEGEVRLILDSRTLGAAGAAGRAATHVEVVVEFAVQAPALGKPLPGRIARRPLAPAEALGIVALLAAALEEALDAGYSHGWLTAASAWNLRRRACLVDMVAGLAMPDDEQVEVAEQVSGYFAPERIAGGAANEAADVFALGWMLYASLVGIANLDGYYAETVAAAGSASTAELLALWRERSREHVRGLLAEDSALAVLLLGALAERPADRPTLAAFRAAATEAAHALAGAAALVVYQPKKRPAAAVAGAVVAGAVVAGAVAGVAAMEAAELIAAESAESESVESTSESTATDAAEAESAEAVGAGALAAAGVAGLAVGAVAMEALLEAEDTGAAANLGSAGQTGAAGYAAAQGSGAGVEHAAAVGGAAAGAAGASVAAGTASSSEFEAAAMESSGAGAGYAEASLESSGAGAGYAEASFESSGAGAGHGAGAAAGAAGAGHAAGAARKRRPRMGAGLLVACGVALLAIGLGSGYAFGASGSHTSSSSMANTKSGIVLGAASSATGAACAPSASASASGAVVAAASASVVAAASESASAPASAAWNENAALPLPTSTAAAVSQLNQIVQGAESSGLISGATAGTLRGEVTAVQQAIASGAGLSTAWTQLSNTIQSGQAQGTIPQALSLQLNSALSYLSSAAGS